MSRNLTTSTNTPTIIEVPSTAGFSAGDLVYYANGSYGNGSGATGPSSATFNLTSTQPIYGGQQGSPVISTTSGNTGSGVTYGQFAAKLTSGNIVQVYLNPINGYPTFQIVNSTMTSVLYGPTTIQAIGVPNSSAPLISVVALTGGGFAVLASTNYTTGPYIAVYTNTGTVTTAGAPDTTLTSTYYQTNYISQIKAMPNGGFLVCCQNNSYVSVRAYTSTGTGVFAWITISSPAAISSYAIADIAVRSDSSWLVAWPTSTNNTIGYGIYSATGTAIVSPTSFTSTNGNTGYTISSVSCTCLSDGTTFVLGYVTYNASSYFISFFRFIPTGNTLGSEFYIPSTNYAYPYGFPIGYQRIDALSSGNFVIVSGSNFNSQGGTCLCYSVFNSSGTCISLTKSGSASTQAIPRNVPGTVGAGSNSFTYSIVETSGYFYIFYFSGAVQAQGGFAQNAVQINGTTWLPVFSPSTNQTFGTTSIATTGWTASGTTPTQLTYASAGGTFTGTATAGTLTVSPTVIVSQGCQDMTSTTLANGNLLFAVYNPNLPNQIIAYTYSTLGVFIRQDTLVGSGVYPSSSTGSIQLCALTSGKFVLTYIPSSNSTSVNIIVFSSSYAQIGTTGNLVCYTTPSNSNSVSISSLPNDRFVIGYMASGGGNSNFKVYDNTITAVFSSGNISGAAVYNVNAVGNLNNTICISYVSGASQVLCGTYYATSSTNWTAPTGVTAISGGAQPSYYSGRGVSSPNGFFYMPWQNSSTNIGNVIVFNDGTNNPNTFSTNNATTAFNYWNLAVGVTSQGSIAVVNVNSGTAYLRVGYNSVSIASVTLPASISVQTASYGGALNITPAYGYNFALSYLNGNNYPTFAIIVGVNGIDYSSISSSSPSQGVPIYPIATTTTSPAITGTVLAGVAVTPASAGGTGQIQTSGFAKLNSNYPSTGSVAFDSTGQAVQGIRGIANGQNVIITGNT